MLKAIVFLSLGLLMAGCATSKATPIHTVEHVELARFMGPWYVQASIPTFLEKDAYNAVESYVLNPDGTIATTFTFHKGSFTGPVKTMHPKGFVLDSSNALWGMQFLWPFKAEYRISYLDHDYSTVIIARTARDYVWIMSRASKLSEAEYAALVQRVADLGYDVAKLRKVPQQWP
jgi:apolipoprotein D and lipocalin family protein